MRMNRVTACLSALALGAGLLLAHSASATADVVEPKVNDCLLVDGDSYDTTAAFDIVDCAETHNAEVIKVLPYPEDAGSPSTIKDRVWELFGGECSFEDMWPWVGFKKGTLPIFVGRYFRLPSDDEWEGGARWVICQSMWRTAAGEVRAYEGRLPEIFAATPLLEWALCLNRAPKSGSWNSAGACTSKSTWLFVPGIMIKGKPGKTYPKDFQARANALCAKKAKPFLKKGAKTKPVAGLGPASDFPPGEIWGDCFIAKSDWNGKAG
jgi:hypothetical protein